jgi:hypothetical protein
VLQSVTWINLNEGTAKPLSDSEAALRAKPLGGSGFPDPQRWLSRTAPQTAWLRGTMGASQMERRPAHSVTSRLTSRRTSSKTLLFTRFEKHQLLRNILVF